jgi:hypothetical protein
MCNQGYMIKGWDHLTMVFLNAAAWTIYVYAVICQHSECHAVDFIRFYLYTGYILRRHRKFKHLHPFSHEAKSFLRFWDTNPRLHTMSKMPNHCAESRLLYI